MQKYYYQRLRDIREDREKTQKEIADILGISRSYVSRIEKKCLERLLDELKE